MDFTSEFGNSIDFKSNTSNPKPVGSPTTPKAQLLSTNSDRRPVEESDSKQLLNIPNELVQRITTFLPDHSAAALCLISKRALAILGTHHLCKISRPIQFDDGDLFGPRQREGPEFERWEFLRLLDRDLKDYILCQYCQKFHKPIFKHSKPLPDCYRFGWRRFNHKFPDYTRVQYVMKQHRQGLDPQIALRKLDEEFSLHRSKARSYDPVQSLEGRIVSVVEGGQKIEKLYVEYKIEQRLPMRISSGILQGCDNTVKICAHMQRDVRVMFECQAVHFYKREKPCYRCAPMRHCKVCRTEIFVEIERRPDPYSTVVVKAWQDLGEGFSICDPNWWSHSEEGAIDEEVQEKLKFKPGSLRWAFEAAGVADDDWD